MEANQDIKCHLKCWLALVGYQQQKSKSFLDERGDRFKITFPRVEDLPPRLEVEILLVSPLCTTWHWKLHQYQQCCYSINITTRRTITKILNITYPCSSFSESFREPHDLRGLASSDSWPWITITMNKTIEIEQAPKNYIHSWSSLPPVHNLTEVIVLIFILVVFSFRLSGNTQSNIAIQIQFNCHWHKAGHHHKGMVNHHHHLHSWMYLLKRSFLRSRSSMSP